MAQTDPTLLMRCALPRDLSEMRELLQRCALPVDDIHQLEHHFWLAETKGRLVGTVGLEVYGDEGLLRSLCVDPSFRDRGLGQQLTELLFQQAQVLGIGHLYLLTTTADTFFQRAGFDPCARDQAPEAIRQTVSFSELCPQSAVLMYRAVNSP